MAQSQQPDLLYIGSRPSIAFFVVLKCYEFSIEEVSMTTFEQYLSYHKIDPIRLSVEAGVPYLTVMYAVDEKPIFSYNAQRTRVALYRLTGLTYTGSLPMLDEPTIDPLPLTLATEYTSRNDGCEERRVPVSHYD